MAHFDHLLATCEICRKLSPLGINIPSHDDHLTTKNVDPVCLGCFAISNEITLLYSQIQFGVFVIWKMTISYTVILPKILKCLTSGFFPIKASSGVIFPNVL